MLNDIIKTFHLIKENGLEIFKCQVFPDRCQNLRPSEMAGPLSCALIFQRVRNRMDSGVVNEIDGQGVHGSR
jgi:hypothetical protein